MSIFKKVIKAPVNASKKSFKFVDRKLTESNVRSDARYQYYDQFPSEILENKRNNLNNKTGSTKHRVSMDSVMKKRGYKYDNNLEGYYMYSEYRLEKELDRDIELKYTPKREYREIEDELRAKAFRNYNTES